MNHYVIYKNSDGIITKLDLYDSSKISIDKIKTAISDWEKTDDSSDPILIEDENIIEILDYVYRDHNNIDIRDEIYKYETAIDEISKILEYL